MRHEDFLKFQEKFFNDVRELTKTKGIEYAHIVKDKDGPYVSRDHLDDQLANFKEQARELGMKPVQVAQVYMFKHWRSITKYFKDVNAGRKPELSETIESRFRDLVLYLILIEALIEETNHPGLNTGAFELK
jgi:hypothetical protein